MKLSLFKKVCLTVMGVGVVSSLVSVGTFATFTATTTNPGNTFAAGTLTLSDVTADSGTAGIIGPQGTFADPTTGSSQCASFGVAQACGYALKSTQVTAEGLEPGQYVQGKITLTNGAATGAVLPATVAMQVQQVQTVPCTSGLGNTCADPGLAFTVSISDTAPVTQCLFGVTGGGTPADAPTAGPTGAFTANTGACDSITGATYLGTTAAPLSVSPTHNLFGVCPTLSTTCASAAAKSFASFAGINGSNLIFVKGNTAGLSTTASGGTLPALTGVPQWGPNESHVFTVTIGFPETGITSGVTTLGSDTILSGNDNQYQGATVRFDLVWYAFQ